MTRIFQSGGVAITLALIFGVAALGSTTLRASAVCTGRSSLTGYSFDGWGTQNEGSTVGGVYAQIENQTVVVSTGSPTTAWVMISSASNPNHYAQVGWLQWANGNRNTMLQVSDPVSGVTTRDSADAPQPVGSYPYYTVLYNNTPGKFTFEVGGAAFPWSGYQVTAGFAPNQTSISAEVQDQANQMPGRTSDALGFFGAQKYKSGSWGNFNGSVLPGRPSWAAYDGPYYGTTHYIWDTAC